MIASSEACRRQRRCRERQTDGQTDGPTSKPPRLICFQIIATFSLVAATAAAAATNETENAKYTTALSRDILGDKKIDGKMQCER